jgi:phosphatidylserine/phosphatidylglycerophosphate/cardiolipin synthase-like enzyme
MTTPNLYDVWSIVKKHEKITIGDLINTLKNTKGWKRSEIKLLVIKAIRERHIEIIDSDVDFEKCVVKATDIEPKKDDLMKPSPLETPTRGKVNGIQITATVPDTVKGEVELESIRFVSMQEAFSKILDNTNKTLRLSLPFIEPTGIWILMDSIIGCAERNVEFRILTREIFKPSQDIGWIRRIKALLKLYDIVVNNSTKKSDLIKIRDFHKTIGGKMGYQFESSHAKLILGDENVAYVGSGEWRENSLVYNFEVGIVIQGPIVETLVKLFDVVWGKSKVVSIEELKKCISMGETIV